MGLFGNSKGITPKSKSLDVDTSNYDYDIVIDGIKKYISNQVTTSTENDYKIFEKFSNGFTLKEKEQMKIHSIYDETNEFFEMNMRTSTLRLMTKKVASRVLDDISFFNGDEIDYIDFPINLDGLTTDIKFHLKTHDFNEATRKLLLYSETYMIGNINSNGDLVFKSVEPFRIFVDSLGNTNYMYFDANGTPSIERRSVDNIDILKYDFDLEKFKLENSNQNPFNNQMVFYLNTNDVFLERATLDLVLMYSYLWNNITNESALTITQILADKGFLQKSGRKKINLNRSVFTPMNVLNRNSDAGVVERPILENFTPQIRANDLLVMKDMVEEQISKSVSLDNHTLGFSQDETARLTSTKNSDSEETINALKNEFSVIFQEFMIKMTGIDSIVVKIPDYKIISRQNDIQNIKDAVNYGYMTVETAVRELHTDWTTEQVEVEAFTLMYQQGLTFTDDQQAKAIELGILEPDAGEGLIIEE